MVAVSGAKGQKRMRRQRLYQQGRPTDWMWKTGKRSLRLPWVSGRTIGKEARFSVSGNAGLHPSFPGLFLYGCYQFPFSGFSAPVPFSLGFKNAIFTISFSTSRLTVVSITYK